MGTDVLALAVELRDRGETFALATVVRCERPSSAKPGARALIRGDGSIAGWVGGACAEPVVVREALAALADGQPRLLSLVGEASPGRGPAEGLREYTMTCHSGGTLEIYVEPFLPRPLLVLVGQGPVVDALAALGRATDFAVAVVGAETAAAELARLPMTPETSVVVATHGSFDEDALERVLASDVGYVSLVASRKRAASVAESLGRRGTPAERIGRLKAPAGLDLGAVTPGEIAVSILAEVIQIWRAAKARAGERAAPTPPSPPADARDPVCGMIVEIATARHRSSTGGRAVYFCCARCRQMYESDPTRYAAALGP
jgi:xanthine dehydrogenase accessory factor